MLKKIFTKNYIFIILVLLSPGFWWVILQGRLLIKEWFNFPNYFLSNVKSIYREEKIESIKTLRWANIDRQGWDYKISKVYYNKGTILVDEFFSFLTFFSPRLYFHSGDGGNFSPPYVEPIPVIFLPLYFSGILVLLKKRKFRLLITYFAFGIFAFLVGKKNMAYLLPVMLMTLFFVSLGISTLHTNIKSKVLWIIILYSLFTEGRLIWLILSKA